MKVYGNITLLSRVLGKDKRALIKKIGKEIIEINRVNRMGKEEMVGYILKDDMVKFILNN